jgi:signal transduction histidine kinase
LPRRCRIGQLTGGIAHDFNNLLGVITGDTDLLLKDLGALHPGAKRAEQIRRAAERAAELIRQLLAFAASRRSSRRSWT